MYFRMITCQEKALEQMRLGLFDVLPSGSLDALTAEDFRLLLNGVSFKIFYVVIRRNSKVRQGLAYPYFSFVQSYIDIINSSQL